jgi:hypothetical protein
MVQPPFYFLQRWAIDQTALVGAPADWQFWIKGGQRVLEKIDLNQ